jgi:16S rRNA (adenine1518-N6/adenine1519-N6)-dimethyltransferase
VIRETLRKFNIRLNKDLGQNFLPDKDALDRIIKAAEVSKDDLVLEIGTGIGTLTKPLAQKAGFVVSIEIDAKLIPAAKEYLAGIDNIELINEDVMKLDIPKILKKHPDFESAKVVSNLPYCITTPLISKLLERENKFKLMVITIQKEVAKRIVSPPGGKEYGAFTVFVNYFAKPKIISYLSKTSFIPQPEVDSAILKLEVLARPSVGVKDEKLFFRVVRAAFNQRRKMLKNALQAAHIEWPADTDIDGKRRGETLSIQEFAKLSNLIKLTSF